MCFYVYSALERFSIYTTSLHYFLIIKLKNACLQYSVRYSVIRALGINIMTIPGRENFICTDVTFLLTKSTDTIRGEPNDIGALCEHLIFFSQKIAKKLSQNKKLIR